MMVAERRVSFLLNDVAISSLCRMKKILRGKRLEVTGGRLIKVHLYETINNEINKGNDP